VFGCLPGSAQTHSHLLGGLKCSPGSLAAIVLGKGSMDRMVTGTGWDSRPGRKKEESGKQKGHLVLRHVAATAIHCHITSLTNSS